MKLLCNLYFIPDSNRTCTHTDTDNGHLRTESGVSKWWRVDLQTEYLITSILVWSRTYFHDKLNGTQVIYNTHIITYTSVKILWNRYYSASNEINVIEHQNCIVWEYVECECGTIVNKLSEGLLIINLMVLCNNFSRF